MLDTAQTKCDEIVNEMTEKFSEATDENRQIIQKYADNKIASYFSDLHKEIAQFQMSPLSGQERTEYIYKVKLLL